MESWSKAEKIVAVHRELVKFSRCHEIQYAVLMKGVQFGQIEGYDFGPVHCIRMQQHHFQTLSLLKTALEGTDGWGNGVIGGCDCGTVIISSKINRHVVVSFHDAK